jgi:hypothetical protein
LALTDIQQGIDGLWRFLQEFDQVHKQLPLLISKKNSNIMNKTLLGLMLFASLSAYAEEFPADLRLPTKEELAKEPERKKSPTKYARVTADFNGDGKTDNAFLLVNINTHKNVFAIKLSTDNGYDWKIIDKGQLDWGKPSMAIELATPGKYETECGKGYYECPKNEPESVTLKNPGLWYSNFFDKGENKLVF